MNEAIRNKLSKMFDFSDNPKKWICDIYSIMSKQILEYNDYISYNPGEKFLNVSLRSQTLKDLLHEDLDFLFINNPDTIGHLRGKISIEEVNENIPNSSIVYSSKQDEYLILFNAPLLNLIHIFYSYFELLTQSSKTETCKEEYDDILQSEKFADTTLVGEIMKAIKKIYQDKQFYSSSTFEFYNEPYNICERVQSVRRFIIAHEISHIVLNHNANEYENASGNLKSTYYFKREEEYQADALGAELVLNSFLKSNITPIEFYELVNVASGIRIYFIMLEFIESFHKWYSFSPEYPFASFRDFAVTNYMLIWSNKNNRDLSEYIVNLTIMKNLFRKLPFDAPVVKYSSAIMSLMAHCENLDAKGILDEVKDSETASFILNNKGYYTFYNEYKIYNFEIFKHMEIQELGFYFYFYSYHFGPEYAFNKIKRHFDYLNKFDKNSIGIIDSLEGSSFQQEAYKVTLRQYNINEFINTFNATYEEYYNKSVQIFNVFKNN